MRKVDCLNGNTGWIVVGFVERERTPEQIVEMAIQARYISI